MLWIFSTLNWIMCPKIELNMTRRNIINYALKRDVIFLGTTLSTINFFLSERPAETPQCGFPFLVLHPTPLKIAKLRNCWRVCEQSEHVVIQIRAVFKVNA